MHLSSTQTTFIFVLSRCGIFMSIDILVTIFDTIYDLQNRTLENIMLTNFKSCAMASMYA
jgi:hypothetical protein